MTINHATIAQNGIIRPTNVEVDLDRLSENFAKIAEHVSPAKMMAILKANAYGHGMIPVAHHLVSLGVDYLGVAVLEEGLLAARSRESTRQFWSWEASSVIKCPCSLKTI